MAQQRGKELVLKRETSEGSGTFVLVCGVRDVSFSIGSEEIDTTVRSCTDETAAIVATAIAGRQNIEFTISSGIFEDSASVQGVANDARLQRVWNYQVVVPGFGTFEGGMSVLNFEWDGPMEEMLGFSGTFKFADVSDLAFTAA
jgi:TP901-1 family phage major tail protein